MKLSLDLLRKRVLCKAGLAVLAFGLVLVPAQRATADDEEDETEIRVEGPLGAVDCTAGAATITVLGLSISIEGAIESSDDSSGSCADLTVGENVQVRLTSDAAPLVATRVDPDHSDGEGGGKGDEHDVRIQAPLQAVAPTALTVQVLGLPIDVSAAELEGADDHQGSNDQGADTECDSGDCQPIDISQLVVGQFVQIKLDPASLPPLVATEVEVKNFTNGIVIHVVRSNGRPSRDHVHVEVVDTVKVRDNAGHLVSRRVRLRTDGARRVPVPGLPTGRAKVTVRRTSDGARKTMTRIRIRPNATRTVRVRLP